MVSFNRNPTVYVHVQYISWIQSYMVPMHNNRINILFNQLNQNKSDCVIHTYTKPFSIYV